MVYEQNTLIEIDEKDRLSASIATKGFADEEIQNRAYINTLGAELALKHLSSQDIDTSNVSNLHSIKKVLEELDISDIMLSNIHIDVRVVYDENYIFIPKSHFEYNIVPDVYFVFILGEYYSNVNFLGFFEPKLINKNNANEEYYFIEKEKLSSVDNLKNYIEKFSGNTNESLSIEELESCEQIMISMADNNITDNEKKYIIQQLSKNSYLRDRFIEFENFEMLAYNAVNQNPIIIDDYSTEIPSINYDFTPEIDFSDDNQMDEEVIENNFEEIEEIEEILDFENFDEIEEIEETSEHTESFNEVNNIDADFDLGIAAVAPIITPPIMPIGLDILPDIDFGDINIENKITLEEIEESTLDSIPPINAEIYKEITSIDNINTSTITPEIEIDFNENIMSFNDIDIENPLEQDVIVENLNDDTMAFADIDAAQDIETEDTSFEPLEESFSFPEIEINEEQDNSDNNADFMDDSGEEKLSIEDLDLSNEELSENVGEESLEDFDNIMGDFEEEFSQEISDIDNKYEENIETEEVEVNKSESFGKNLLESLTSNSDDIAIQGLDDIESLLNDSDIEVEDVSSNSLLAEIDDILSDDEDIIEHDDILEEESKIEKEDIQEFFNAVAEGEFEDEDVPTSQIHEAEYQQSDVGNENEEEIVQEKTDETGEIDDTGEELGLLFDENLENIASFEDDLSEIDLESLNDNQKAPAFLKLANVGNKKTILATAAIIAVIASVSAVALLKPKNNDMEPIANMPETPSQESPINPLTESNKDISTSIPDITVPKTNETKTVSSNELKNNALSKSKPASSTESYLSVQRLVWEVPDYLSYSDKFKTYLKTAGKSIKLSLSSDLLLATEYAYTNSVKVNVQLSSDGSVTSANIVNSSGSTQIDQIVLQSVKDTLNVVKPPSGEIKAPNFNLSIIIYL